MTAIHYGVFLAGAADGWYRRNRAALECRDSMDRPFYLVEKPGDRRAACGVLRNSLTDNLPVLRA